MLVGLLATGVLSVREGWTLAIQGAAAAGRLAEPAPADVTLLVLGAAGLGLLGVGTWSCAVALVATADLVRRRPPTRAGALRPAWVRSLVLGCAPALGASVLCTAGPVAADPGDHAGGATGLGRLTGLHLPTRPVTTAPPRSTRPPPAQVRVVHAGECLWSVAADLLGDRAPVEVDRAWRRMYRANRERVGEDPDLVHPGTRLVVPASLTPHPNPNPSR